jgi:hypothetical protein
MRSVLRKRCTLIAGLGACGLLGAILWPDPTWALPKKSTWLWCKCTCRADDELGKHHYGSTGGISYTTSHDSCDAFHKCKVGLLEGIATDCLGTEKSGVKAGGGDVPASR